MVPILRNSDRRGNGEEDSGPRSKHEEDEETRKYRTIVVISLPFYLPVFSNSFFLPTPPSLLLSSLFNLHRTLSYFDLLPHFYSVFPFKNLDIIQVSLSQTMTFIPIISYFLNIFVRLIVFYYNP